MRYDYSCIDCSKIQEEWHGMLEKPVVFCHKCGGKCVKLIGTGQQIMGMAGGRDLYDFVDVNTTGVPIKFNSKRQWKEHLKRHGLNDDVKNDPLTKSDVENMQRKEVRKKEENHRKIRDKVIDVVKNTPQSKLRERAKRVIKKGA